MSVVLVAGATGPIGQGVSRLLAARGHTVVAHYRSARRRAEALVASLGAERPHRVVGGDLTRPGVADALVREAVAEPDEHLAAVVNCAWPSHPSVLLADAAGVELLEASFDGVRAHLALCRAALPSLRRSQGSVVLLGGALATRLHPALGYFSLGKAAATTATLTLALEEGPHGVRANVVAPGRVDVGDGDLAESDPAYAALDRVGRLRRALPTLPTVDEVARIVAFLVGPDGVGVTGQVLGVAGGEPL